MAGQANTAFLARHLLRSEYPRAELEEVPGGFLVHDDAVWLAVHNPKAAGDPEKLIQSSQAASQGKAAPLAGAILLLDATTAADQAHVEPLEEALYVYGYPRAKGLHRGGPEIVYALPNMPALVPKPELYFERVDPANAAAQKLFAESQQSADQITGPAWNRSKAWFEHSEPWLASNDITPVGLVSYLPGELFGRIVMLIVEEAQRNQGFGRELVSHAQSLGAQQGAQFTTVWNYREGKLRYYIGKLGFSEQLNVQYYLAGQPV